MLVYHGLLITLAAASALALRRAPRWGWLAVAGAVVVASLAATLGVSWFLPRDDGFFAATQLLAVAIFGYGPPYSCVLALAVWPARRLSAALVGLGLLGVAVGIDAFVIEPSSLEVRFETVAANVPERLRIVVLSDVQTDHVGAYEREVFRRSRALRPDLVIYPGDYVQLHERGAYETQAARLRSLVATLRPRLGALAVRGNVEWDGWTDAVFRDTGVQASDETTTSEHGPLTITALSFDDSFEPNLRVPHAGGFHVVFGHGPDFSLGRVDADLLVAGHTHGGQVQLPFVGPPVIASRVSRRHGAGGRFSMSGGRTLVVTRGVGMEREAAARLRFLCHPEIVVIDLVPRAE